MKYPMTKEVRNDEGTTVLHASSSLFVIRFSSFLPDTVSSARQALPDGVTSDQRVVAKRARADVVAQMFQVYTGRPMTNLTGNHSAVEAAVLRSLVKPIDGYDIGFPTGRVVTLPRGACGRQTVQGCGPAGGSTRQQPFADPGPTFTPQPPQIDGAFARDIGHADPATQFPRQSRHASGEETIAPCNTHVLSDNTSPGNAVTVCENQILAVSGSHRLIENSTLAKSTVFVPHIPQKSANGAAQRRHHRRRFRRGFVIGNDNFGGSSLLKSIPSNDFLQPLRRNMRADDHRHVHTVEITVVSSDDGDRNSASRQHISASAA